MCPRSRRLLTLSISVCALSLIAGVTAEHSPGQTQSPSPDGVLHSEASLAGHAVTVEFAPALKADDPAHRVFFSGAGSGSGGRLRIGRLVTSNGTLRLGTLELPKADR